MSAHWTIHVRYLDGREIDVVAGPRARVEVERRFDMSYAKAFGSGTARDEVFYVLAWAALHFSDKEDADFDDWLTLIEDADIVREEQPEGDANARTSAAGRPTKRAQKPADSST